jgi:hypothetical protein
LAFRKSKAKVLECFAFTKSIAKLFFIFCSQGLAFVKSKAKVFFISLFARFGFCEKHSKIIFHFFARTKKRNKEMRRLIRRRTAYAA